MADISEAKEKIKDTKKYEQKKLNVRHRTKKSIYSHIWIEKKDMAKDGTFNFYTSYGIGEIKLTKDKKEKNVIDGVKTNGDKTDKNKEKEKLKITSDFVIRRNNRLDSWEVIISEKVKAEDIIEHKNFVTFDPGVRTFLTG